MAADRRLGNVPIADVLAAVDVTFPSPDPPAAIKSWQEAEKAIEKERRGDLS